MQKLIIGLLLLIIPACAVLPLLIPAAVDGYREYREHQERDKNDGNNPETYSDR